jgi:hypothetical protein
VWNTLFALVAAYALAKTYLLFRWGFASGAVGFDFKGTLWDPAIAIREGRAFYPEPVVAAVDVANPALYPPLGPILVTPLTLLPWSLGVTAWILLLCLAMGVTLWALDVRDPRCYVLAGVAAPVVDGALVANATIALLPLVALGWRWRNRSYRAGVAIGLAIAMKLFLWPVVFWLIGTRRYRAALVAAVTASASLLIPWAAVRFEGLTSYPELLAIASDIYGTQSASLTTVLAGLGIAESVATRVPFLVGLVLASTCVAAGRRRADAFAFSLAVLAAILASPIAWSYYYALALIPIAIFRPRFSAVWLVAPLLFLVHFLPRPRLPSAAMEPGGTACCPPDDVPALFWEVTHAGPALWPAVAYLAFAGGVGALAALEAKDRFPPAASTSTTRSV